ncbi:RNA methyltransferase, partial [filamentous cyanobacterium CCP5]
MGQYFATVARGLESLAAEELVALGASAVKPGFCGVEFQGDQALLYKVNLWGRLPFRVLVRLGEFPCSDGDELYQGIQAIDWRPYLTPRHTLAVDATGKTGRLNHTHFSALQVKNAIVDQQRDQSQRRSNIDTESPDVRVNVHLHRGRATASLDSSGSSLHRRGYRPAVGAAPLKESLAAALIAMTDWQSGIPFFDPLCGSGTLPIEASLIALNIAPGLFRESFGFQSWPNFDETLWEQITTAAWEQQNPELTAPVMGCDRDPAVIVQAKSNASDCGLQHQIKLWCQDLA